MSDDANIVKRTKSLLCRANVINFFRKLLSASLLKLTSLKS